MEKRKRKSSSKTGSFKHRAYDRIRLGLGKCFRRCCPMLQRFLYSKRTEFRGLKAMLGFPVGVLFGLALYVIILERLMLTNFVRHTLGAILVLTLGIGYAGSVQVRCICWLIIPTFCGQTGRAYISTFALTFIITGPLDNIMFNAHESVRVLNCIASLSVNHTVERFKLMFKPIKDIIMDFAGAGKEIQTDSKQIKEVYNPIDEEAKDMEEVKESESDIEHLDKEVGSESRVKMVKSKFKGYKEKLFGGESEGKYGMKSEIRCEEVFTKGVKGCRNSFKKAEDQCHSKLPLIGYLLCWPMKLTFICNIASSLMGKRSCDSKNGLTPGFGESIDTAEGVQKEFDKNFEVNMQYKLVMPKEQVDQITPEDVGKAIENQFSIRKRNFDFLMNMISRLLAFMFLHVFHLSRKYCNKYLRNIDHDNKYITSYFRHIDARRRKQDKKTLLPLRKSEKLELSDPFAVKFSAEEKQLLLINSLRLIGEIVTTSIIISFDWLFFEFLMLLQRHSRVDYRQTGVHHISMKIYGDGMMGKLVRKILKGFDKKHETDSITSTAECLPQPRKLETKAIINIYLIFLLIWILMLLESYGLRFRRVICGFFFPKREKKRVLFLYNDHMKKRKGFLRHMRHRIRKMAREQAISIDTGILEILRHRYSKYFGWLGKLGIGKRRCLVCEEPESKRKFQQCSETCPFVYCNECWHDMKEHCYVCLSDDDEDSELTEDDDEDDL